MVGSRRGVSCPSQPDLPALSLIVSSMSSPSSSVSSGSLLCSGRVRALDSRDLPVTSLRSAETFVKGFVDWCARAGIAGSKDWYEVFELSQFYAHEDEHRSVSPMAFAKAWARLGLPKKTRPRMKHEKPDPRLKGHSAAKNPRVTVYVIPGATSSWSEDGLQLDLFD